MEVRKMGGIRLLTMDEKPANTLTPVVLHELAGLLRDLEKDRGARTVVLCSETSHSLFLWVGAAGTDAEIKNSGESFLNPDGSSGIWDRQAYPQLKANLHRLTARRRHRICRVISGGLRFSLRVEVRLVLDSRSIVRWTSRGWRLDLYL